MHLLVFNKQLVWPIALEFYTSLSRPPITNDVIGGLESIAAI